MEGLAALGQKKVVELSSQQLIDCDNVGNNGCNGGWSYKAFAYAAKHGLMSRSDYPLTGQQGQCLFDESKVAFKNTDMVQERLLSNEKLKSVVSK